MSRELARKRDLVDTLESVHRRDLFCLNFLRECASVLEILETQVKKRRKRDKPRPPILTFEEHMATTTEADFRSLYRLHLEDFNTLHDEMLLLCPEFVQSRSPVESKVRLLSTLRYLAGGSPLDAARNYGMARPTFDNHLKINLRCIIKVETKKHRYNFNDAAQLAQIEKLCCIDAPGAGQGEFRNCIGFIDGITISIRKPNYAKIGNPQDFYCDRKKMYAINAMGVCDGSLRFRFFDIGMVGNTHDSTVLECSTLGMRMEKGRVSGGIPNPYFFVGDNAYAISDIMVVPFPGRDLEDREDTFNYVISSYRSCIERAFGILVRRWGVLWRPLDRSLKINVTIIAACVMLHNICINKGRSDNVRRHSFDQGIQPTLEEVRSIYLNNAEGSDGGSRSVTREILAEKFMQQGIRRSVQTSNMN